MTWYRVEVPADSRHGAFCCGLDVEDGRVVRAAPIMAWTVGLALDLVGEWVSQRHGTIDGPHPVEPRTGADP